MTKVCFLCGCPLSTFNLSISHVVPSYSESFPSDHSHFTTLPLKRCDDTPWFWHKIRIISSENMESFCVFRVPLVAVFVLPVVAIGANIAKESAENEKDKSHLSFSLNHNNKLKVMIY